MMPGIRILGHNVGCKMTGAEPAEATREYREASESTLYVKNMRGGAWCDTCDGRLYAVHVRGGAKRMVGRKQWAHSTMRHRGACNTL